MRPLGKVFISPKFISISCIYVTPECLCTNMYYNCYVIQCTAHELLISKTVYHVLENKTSLIRTITLLL